MRTPLTARALVLLDKHRRFVGCDNDTGCMQKSMQTPVEVYFSQTLNEISVLTADEQLKEAGSVVLAPEQRKRLMESLDSWRATPDLPSIQTFRSM